MNTSVKIEEIDGRRVFYIESDANPDDLIEIIKTFNKTPLQKENNEDKST